MVSRSGSFPDELLARARSGCESSLGRLLVLYNDQLRAAVATQLDERLRARVSSSDVVQETFFEAHRDFPSFRGATPEEFLGWLRRILANNVLRAVELHLKAAKRDVRREVPLDRVGPPDGQRRDPELERLAAAPQETPSAMFERREKSDHLAALLAGLPSDYREVLRLRHQEGLDFASIGERMGRSAGAVRMLWLRGVKRLRSACDAPLPESPPDEPDDRGPGNLRPGDRRPGDRRPDVLWPRAGGPSA